MGSAFRRTSRRTQSESEEALGPESSKSARTGCPFTAGLDYCADFFEEPEPNGCAANYGAYGNTAEAATKAGAEHCVCPVEETP